MPQILAVNIRDGELNENDMTHDELMISRNIYMYILKRKLSLSHTQTNKQQLQQPTKGVTVYCACV